MNNLRLLLFLATMFAGFLVAGKLHAADYRVAAEDVLTITVFDEPDLSVRESRVSTSGAIAMPLIGDVRVAGRTTDQIAVIVERKLADGYLKKPRVSVSIHEYRQIFVNGEVKEPGGYSFREGLTVQKAIVLAGGLTERASESKISLITEKSPNETRRVTLDHRVSPGDVITVGESFF